MSPTSIRFVGTPSFRLSATARRRGDKLRRTELVRLKRIRIRFCETKGAAALAYDCPGIAIPLGTRPTPDKTRFGPAGIRPIPGFARHPHHANVRPPNAPCRIRLSL